jgi:hypothetical protein
MQPSGAHIAPGASGAGEQNARGQSPSRATGSGADVPSLRHSAPLPPRCWAKGFTFRQTDYARARIAAALTITVPADEAAQMVRDYARLGLLALARRYGYAPEVVRRTLVSAGVVIRPKGRPRK